VIVTHSPKLPVIVAGAGPVGMTAAAARAGAGIPTVVIEATPEPQPDWRASTFHAATLELLDELGITERMCAEGLVVPRYQFRDRADGLIAEFDLTLLAEETRFPYRLQLNQQRLVRFLYDRLLADGAVQLRFGTRLSTVDQDAGGVEVGLETPDGPQRLRGSYLIGADGAASTVRKHLGVAFDGFTYPQRFLIVSTPVDMREQVPGIAEVNYVADPVQWLFILRTPEAWRVLWPVPAGTSTEEATAPDEIQRQLSGVAPRPGGYPVSDHQIYNVHQRVAETFRTGRVMLIGDAAHVNSPVGGVGLNSGIHDAMDLTRRLARILHDGTDPDAELDTFAACRRRVALEYVQADTQRNTDRLAETDPQVRRNNQRELAGLAADPDRARAWLRRVSLLESVRRFGIGASHTEFEGSPA
jgi:2-polyprenyl-6-methoxyphenol hydroxylase-like FAD-dependent oxidoreductase